MRRDVYVWSTLVLAPLLVTVSGESAGSVTRQAWIEFYEDRLGALRAQDAALPSDADEIHEWTAHPGVAAHLDRLVQRSDRVGWYPGLGDHGGPETLGFPIAGSFFLLSDYFATDPPPPHARCNQPGASGAFGHYDQLLMPVDEEEALGTAQDHWPLAAGTLNLAGVHSPIGPPKLFWFETPVFYAGVSDFWCSSMTFCFFGFCYYEELLWPIVDGAADECRVDERIGSGLCGV